MLRVREGVDTKEEVVDVEVRRVVGGVVRDDVNVVFDLVVEGTSSSIVKVVSTSLMGVLNKPTPRVILGCAVIMLLAMVVEVTPEFLPVSVEL